MSRAERGAVTIGGPPAGSHIRQCCAALPKSCTLQTGALHLQKRLPTSACGSGAVTCHQDTTSSNLIQAITAAATLHSRRHTPQRPALYSSPLLPHTVHLGLLQGPTALPCDMTSSSMRSKCQPTVSKGSERHKP